VSLRERTRVLDIAGGTGFPAIPMARRVHPNGAIVSTDISADMTRFAEHRARSEGLTNIEFRRMDAHALGFPDASFDAVTCASGLMLCEDPVKVVSEMRRVLKASGRLAITVWDTPAKNPFLAIFGRAVVSAGLMDRPDRSAPGPFRLSEAGVLEHVLRAGGLDDITIEERSATVTYESIDSYMAMGRTLAPHVAGILADISPEELTRLEELVRTEAEPHLGAGGLHLKATALCAQARIA
jgi:SAM-dependent methyltransferase